MRVVVREFGARRAAARMAHVGERLANPRPVMELVSDDLSEIAERRFRTGGDGDWDALKDSTVRRKGHDRIGIDQGRLHKSLTQPRGRGTSRRIRGSRMTWQTTVPHAGWGPQRGNRDWFRLARRDHKRIGRRLQRWFFKGD